jgi:hypothetical protein
LLVDFPAVAALPDSNKTSILQWMDHTENYPSNKELRAVGTNTPIAGTLTWADTFLTTTQSNDPATCRKSYVILVTDGNENCNGNAPGAAQTLHENGFDVFVVGFAIDGGGRASINAIAQAGGTDANSAIRGQDPSADYAYFANNTSQLQNALAVIFGEIKKGSFSRTAPTLSSDLNNLYLGYFEMPGWKGHLRKYPSDVITDVGLSQAIDYDWDAGDVLSPGGLVPTPNPDVGADGAALSYSTPTPGLVKVRWGDRVLYGPSRPSGNPPSGLQSGPWIQSDLLNAVNPATAVSIPCASIGLSSPTTSQSAENILKFTMNPGFCGGLYKGARDPNWRLGDIYHSDSIIVGPPGEVGVGTEAEVNAYVTFRENYKDRETVIYVGANDGSLHAISKSDGVEKWAWVPNNLSGKLRDQRNGHQIYVDSSPTVRDVYFNGAWKTVLISGERQGGNYYFAIDITDPNNPKPLWEFTHARLGQTWSKPAIGRVQTGNDSYKWVAFVGGGWTSATNTVGCSTSTTGCATTLLVIDIETGTLLNSTTPQLNRFNVGDLGAATPNVVNGLVAPPRALERVFGVVDTVFLGDLDGRLWKFDVTGGASGGNINQWDKCLLYDPVNETPPLPRRPIYKRVSMFSLGSYTYVAFGTGDESQPASSDREWLYVIRDPGKGKCPPTTDENCLITQDGSKAFWYTGKGGQQCQVVDIDGNVLASESCLKAGEKILGRPIAINKRLYFTTYTSTNVCATGTGKFYQIDFQNVQGCDAAQLSVNFINLGPGVPTQAVPIFTEKFTYLGSARVPSGTQPPVFDVPFREPSRITFPVSWREVF